MSEAKQATPHSVLIDELMDSRVPKTEREHAARREIERLQENITTLYAMYEQVSRQRDEVMDQQRAMVAAMRGRVQ